VNEVTEDFVAIDIGHQCAKGDQDSDVDAIAAVLVASGTGTTGGGSKRPLLGEELEAGVAAGRGNQDVAALPSVAAVRPTLGHIFFTAETGCAVSAVSGSYPDDDLIKNAVCRISNRIASLACLFGDGKLSDRKHVNALHCLEGLELDGAVDEGKQGVVPADPHALARLEMLASLPNDDVAGTDDFAVIQLDSQVLRVAVPTVA
jgi:hypothetical protein